MRRKSLHLLFLLSLALVVVLAVAACGSPAETTTTAAPTDTSATTAPAATDTTAATAGSTDTSAATATSAPAAGQGSFEFSLSMHDPLTSNNALFMQAWGEKVTAATGGNVKVTIYPSGQLAAAADVGEMVETGGVDIGWLFTPFYKGQFPLTEVASVPMVGFDNGTLATNVVWDLYAKYPEVQNEWKNYKVLMLYGIPASIFGTTEKAIKTPEDVKGLVLRSPAGLVTDLVTKLGGSPVVMAPPDLYEAIEKKNVNGFIFEPAGIQNFKLQEVTDYFTDLPIYIGVFGLVMNWDKWNALPKEYQAAIEGLSLREGSLAASADMQAAADKGQDVFKAAGAEWIVPTPEAKAAFEAVAKELAATWPTTVKLTGFDAAAYMNDAFAILAGYKK